MPKWASLSQHTLGCYTGASIDIIVRSTWCSYDNRALMEQELLSIYALQLSCKHQLQLPALASSQCSSTCLKRSLA